MVLRGMQCYNRLRSYLPIRLSPLEVLRKTVPCFGPSGESQYPDRVVEPAGNLPIGDSPRSEYFADLADDGAFPYIAVFPENRHVELFVHAAY